jgi:putative oxidoreductase
MGIRLDTLARWLIAFFFIASGAGKAFAFEPSAAIAAAAGLPSPKAVVAGIILLEIAGGVCLLLGFGTKYVSVALIAFLVLASVVFHARFVRDRVSGTDQMVHLIKNVAIIGGLISTGL